MFACGKQECLHVNSDDGIEWVQGEGREPRLVSVQSHTIDTQTD